MQINMNDISFYPTLVYCIDWEKKRYISCGTRYSFSGTDSCRATVKNGNNVSANLTEDAIEIDQNNCCFMLFSDNLVVVLEF